MTDGFEESEFTQPRQALINEGAEVIVVSDKEDSVKAWSEQNWSDSYSVFKQLGACKSTDFDALLLPGGVMNPDQLRLNLEAVKFVTDFIEMGKPIAAICHGPQLLIETGMLKGVKVTSYPSLKTDLINAGAVWVDEEVVVDKGIVTSRTPKDLAAFSLKMIEEFCEGEHKHREIA